MPEVIEPVDPVSIMDLESHHCHWPLEQRGDHNLRLYCGRIVATSSTYCQQHTRMAYVPMRR